MPRISTFLGIVITMYHDDHGHPHFHAEHADGEAKIRIDTLEPIESTLPRRHLRFVLAWAEIHQSELDENWKRARARETLMEIEPLRMSTARYKIIKFEIVDHGVLRLYFADGLDGEVDLREHLWGPVFERVRTRDGFLEAYLDNVTVSWPGGADLAPDTLYERVRTGLWPDALPA